MPTNFQKIKFLNKKNMWKNLRKSLEEKYSKSDLNEGENSIRVIFTEESENTKEVSQTLCPPTHFHKEKFKKSLKTSGIQQYLNF